MKNVAINHDGHEVVVRMHGLVKNKLSLHIDGSEFEVVNKMNGFFVAEIHGVDGMAGTMVIKPLWYKNHKSLFVMLNDEVVYGKNEYDFFLSILVKLNNDTRNYHAYGLLKYVIKKRWYAYLMLAILFPIINFLFYSRIPMQLFLIEAIYLVFMFLMDLITEKLAKRSIADIKQLIG